MHAKCWGVLWTYSTPCPTMTVAHTVNPPWQTEVTFFSNCQLQFLSLWTQSCVIFNWHLAPHHCKWQKSHNSCLKNSKLSSLESKTTAGEKSHDWMVVSLQQLWVRWSGLNKEVIQGHKVYCTLYLLLIRKPNHFVISAVCWLIHLFTYGMPHLCHICWNKFLRLLG